jgi:hypothetical protein
MSSEKYENDVTQKNLKFAFVTPTIGHAHTQAITGAE